MTLVRFVITREFVSPLPGDRETLGKVTADDESHNSAEQNKKIKKKRHSFFLFFLFLLNNFRNLKSTRKM